MSGHSAAMRLAACVVFIALPVGLAAVTALNVVQLREVEDAIAQREGQLGMVEARLRRSVDDGATQRDFSAVWLAGSSQALASAALQTRLGSHVAAADATLIEVQGIADNDSPLDVVLRISFEGTHAAVLSAISAIEMDVPLLTVDQFALRRAGGEAEDPRLRADVTVRGTRRDDGA